MKFQISYTYKTVSCETIAVAWKAVYKSEDVAINDILFEWFSYS